MGLLCTLREPTPEEASRWHKPRLTPAHLRTQALADTLASDTAVRVVKRGQGTTELLIDTGEGTSLRLTFRPDSIDARIGPFLVTEQHPQLHHEAYIDAISEVIEVLQVGSGFYVHSEELIGFEPCGTCPKCGLEVFEWQERCEVCEVPVRSLRAGEDEDDAHATRVVEALLRHKMIELASPRGRRNVEKTVSVYFAYDGTDPAVLLALFMDMADLAEVYCDDKQLGRVLRRIK